MLHVVDLLFFACYIEIELKNIKEFILCRLSELTSQMPDGLRKNTASAKEWELRMAAMSWKDAATVAAKNYLNKLEYYGAMP